MGGDTRTRDRCEFGILHLPPSLRFARCLYPQRETVNCEVDRGRAIRCRGRLHGPGRQRYSVDKFHHRIFVGVLRVYKKEDHIVANDGAYFRDGNSISASRRFSRLESSFWEQFVCRQLARKRIVGVHRDRDDSAFGTLRKGT